MSSNNYALTLFGSNFDTTPTILEVNLLDGSTRMMFSLEHSFDNISKYTTYGAIYHDNKDI